MTGATPAAPETSHYLFADSPSLELWEQASPGSMEQPETSATCIFYCSGIQETTVSLRGPGIKDFAEINLPLESAFLEGLIARKPPFPLGADLFLLIGKGKIIGLPRTTEIEVLR